MRQNKNYSYIISAYYDRAGKDEVLAETVIFSWKVKDTKGAKAHALSKAFKKWPESKGYYCHEAKEVGGE